MKTVLSLLGTILISGISLSADRSAISYSEYEKQLANYQSRDQQLREQIAREQATILDVKNKIESSRQHIDELRRQKLATLGITAEDVDAAIRSFDQFTQDVSTLLNLTESEFKKDSLKAAGCRGHLDTLLSFPACRLDALSAQKKSATVLVGEVEKRLLNLASQSQVAITQPIPEVQKSVTVVEPGPEMAATTPSNSPASYVVRKNGGRSETLFDIAQQVYGNAYLWPRIYQANKQNIDKNFNRLRQGQIRSRIADPSDLIYPGQVLLIPH